MIKIGYFADGIWGLESLKALSKNEKIQIMFVTTRFQNPDNAILDYARELKIPILQHANVNSQEFIKEIEKYECDLLVSMSFNQIFKFEIIKLTKHGIINCHGGCLPFYRGRNPLNWAIINDENFFGITVHYVDEGIDTGDIILQNIYPIKEEDNYGTLLQKSYQECPILLTKAIILILENKVIRIKQESIHKIGTFFFLRTLKEQYINWNTNSRSIFNLIRAITLPGPCAITKDEAGLEIKIIESKMINNFPAHLNVCGQVLYRNDEGCIIKTYDTALLITKIFLNNEIVKPNWKPGTRLISL